MIIKLRCDGCIGQLKDLIKDGAIYSLDDALNGLSLMIHNNLKNKILLCDVCFREFEDKLKEDGDWLSLQQMDQIEDFINFEELVEYIKNEEKWQNK